MATLVITRGLPASGKSTWARQWLAQDPANRARVNREDLRENVFGAAWLDHAGETAVTAVQQAAVEALLRAGRDVVVDDTNLRAKFARLWVEVAARAGAGFEVREFTDVPLEVCLERDAARGAAGARSVGEDVIRDMHERFLAKGPLPALTARSTSAASATSATSAASAPVAGEVYVPDPSLPGAWLVDLDGTLALMNGRSPYDWAKVGRDEPNLPVVELVRGLAATGLAIVVVSGRDGSCRDLTAEWLARHGIGCDALLMRAAGDSRKDAVVKREIFDQEIRDRWCVRGVLDDRDQVVTMWRSLGLLCAQVAPGAF